MFSIFAPKAKPAIIQIQDILHREGTYPVIVRVNDVLEAEDIRSVAKALYKAVISTEHRVAIVDWKVAEAIVKELAGQGRKVAMDVITNAGRLPAYVATLNPFDATLLIQEVNSPSTNSYSLV